MANLRDSEYFIQRAAEALDQQIDIRSGAAKRRRESDDVVGERTENQAVPVADRKQSLPHFQRLVGLGLAGLVRHQFYSRQQSATANVADQRMIRQFTQAPLE